MNTGRPPDTVHSYLAALTGALKALHCPAGLIADAVSDAGEHLNSEITTHPEQSEAEILASVVETYGTPAEIAEEYKSMEATLSGPFPKSEEPRERHYGFFGIIGDPRAYSSLLYMLVSLITGIFYFVWTIVAGVLTLPFVVTIIGASFLPAYLDSLRALGHVEGRIVESLLGVRMPRRMPSKSDGEETNWARIRDSVTDPGNWSTMFYLLTMLPLGIFYFVTAIFCGVVPLGLIVASVVSLITGQPYVHIDGVPYLAHFVATAPGLVATIVVSFPLLFIGLALARLIGWLHGLYAELMLVRI
jgi:uncharacterized membrane protein